MTSVMVMLFIPRGARKVIMTMVMRQATIITTLSFLHLRSTDRRSAGGPALGLGGVPSRFPQAILGSFSATAACLVPAS